MGVVGRLGTIVVVCAALLGGVASPAAVAEEASPDGVALQRALDETVAGGVSGSYANVVDEDGTWQGASGVGDVVTRRAPDASGRIRVASVTKSFVATVVLQLVAEHKIGLDDKIADYLPGLLPYPEPITIRQLLQHTSGLPRDMVQWTSNPAIDLERFKLFEPEELVKLGTDGKPLAFAPGQGWQYSNIGYTTLGLLVEHVTGHPLDAELTTRIFGPLDLGDTSFPSEYPFLPRAAAHGYERLYGPLLPLSDLTTYSWSRLWGSGNLVSSLHDLNRFFAALLDGELLPAEQLREMKHTVSTGGQLGDFEYGLGLMALPNRCDGRTWWGHAGDLPGYMTWSMHTEDASRQVSAGMNQDATVPPQSAKSMFTTVLPTALCDEAPAPAFATKAAPPRLGPLLGTLLG
jgi:D-alanyl-D-alanine carboxypeptidase